MRDRVQGLCPEIVENAVDQPSFRRALGPVALPGARFLQAALDEIHDPNEIGGSVFVTRAVKLLEEILGVLPKTISRPAEVTVR